jgi:hypothetical protein
VGVLPVADNPLMTPTSSQTQVTLPDWYTTYAQDILSNQQAIAARPYTTYQAPRVASATQDQSTSYQLMRDVARPTGLQAVGDIYRNTLGQSAMGAAQPYLGQAGGLSAPGAAAGDLNAASGMIQQASQPTGLNAAQPYLNNAGQTSYSVVDNYLNPYTQQVVDRIGDMGARTLREKLLPEISDNFIRSGQFGGSRQAEAIGRGLRDTMEGISAAQGQALNAGYGQSLEAANTDLNRFANLGQTAGGLGTQQQQALISAGGQLQNIGQTRGQLTAQQQQNLGQLGATAGNLAGEDITQRMNAAKGLTDVSQQQQALGISGANALNAMGQQQQAQNQSNLDLAYSNFKEQRDYPQTQNTGLINALQGTSVAMPKFTDQAGIQPATDSTAYKKSTLDKIIQAGGTALDIANAIKNWI